MKGILSICGVGLALLAPTPVFADTIFNFSYYSVEVHGQPGLPFRASGQFDAVETGTSGVFSIVGASGSLGGYPVDGDLITGVAGAAGQRGTITLSNGVAAIDSVELLFDYGTSNLYSGRQPLLFDLDTGYLADLGTDPTKGPSAGEIAAVRLAIAEASPSTATTPEPGTLVLLATGGLGAIGIVRRRLIL